MSRIGNKAISLPSAVKVNITPEGAVTDFVQDTVKTQFQQAGIKVVDSAAAADRVVTTELLNFWVEETGTYKCDVRATFAVNSKGGASLPRRRANAICARSRSDRARWRSSNGPSSTVSSNSMAVSGAAASNFA